MVAAASKCAHVVCADGRLDRIVLPALLGGWLKPPDLDDASRCVRSGHWLRLVHPFIKLVGVASFGLHGDFRLIDISFCKAMWFVFSFLLIKTAVCIFGWMQRLEVHHPF